MAPALSDLLVTDDLSILLALVGATLFLLKNLYKPQPLVHPILLGRQSDSARVRHVKESAVYRNYGTGIMGHFPVRPEKDINTLHDLVRSDVATAHTLWSTKITNSQLKERAKAFGAGLVRAGLKPQEDNVLLLLQDSIEFIISDLALAAHSIVSFTLSSQELLEPVLDAHPPSAVIVDAALLPHLLEIFLDSNQADHHTVIVVGEITNLPRLKGSQIQILKFADIERDGVTAGAVNTPHPAPSDVFSVAFYPSESGKVHGARLTHANMVAGVAAVRNLVPTSNPLSPLDTAVSMYSLSTLYGRSVAYTAIYEGCNFATLQPSTEGPENSVTRLRRALSADLFPIPPATLLYTDPNHLAALVTPILKQAQKSYLFAFAWRHKLSGMFDGFVTKDSLWDRLVFDQARAEVMKEAAGTLRTVICGGGPQDAKAVLPARIALSIPVVNSYIHGAIAAPVLASHPLDLQIFADDPATGPAHVGPPIVNVEVKLVGVNDEAIENGGDPTGALFARGPPVAELLENSDLDGLSEEDRSGWTKVANKATVQTNGTFKVLEA